MHLTFPEFTFTLAHTTDKYDVLERELFVIFHGPLQGAGGYTPQGRV